MTRALQHLIFDLDGTLVDSAPVILSVVNEMLAERGSARRVDLDMVRPWLSWGGPALIATALEVEGEDVASELADFRARYAARETPQECVFDGVREGLRTLAAAGFTLAICSNKPQHLCEKVLDDVGLTHLFATIVGSTPECGQKPAPDLVNLVLRNLQARPSRSILIGDSDVDQAAARAAGVAFGFVSYGYAPVEWDTSDLTAYARFDALVAALVPETISVPILRKAA